MALDYFILDDHQETQRRLALLKTGYLVVFMAHGFAAVSTPEMGRLRGWFRDPTSAPPWFPPVTGRSSLAEEVEQATPGRMYAVASRAGAPVDENVFVVMFQGRVLLLPRGDGEGMWEALARYEASPTTPLSLTLDQ